jgi:hypothetical protein
LKKCTRSKRVLEAKCVKARKSEQKHPKLCKSLPKRLMITFARLLENFVMTFCQTFEKFYDNFFPPFNMFRLFKTTLYRRPSIFAVLLIRSPKTAFFEEPILQFKPYIGLFIRGFVIRGPVFEERISRE